MGGEDFNAKEGLIIISIVNQKKGGVGKTTIGGIVVKGEYGKNRKYFNAWRGVFKGLTATRCKITRRKRFKGIG